MLIALISLIGGLVLLVMAADWLVDGAVGIARRFGVPTVVSYISQFMTLEPGDIVLTGTPAGVGLGQKPAPWYLKLGDVVRLGATGLGEQQQTCVGG